MQVLGGKRAVVAVVGVGELRLPLGVEPAALLLAEGGRSGSQGRGQHDRAAKKGFRAGFHRQASLMRRRNIDRAGRLLSDGIA